MYKVFINEKPVVLTGEEYTGVPDKQTLVHRYSPELNLKQLVNEFDQNDFNKKLIIINIKNFDLLCKNFQSLFKIIVAAGGIVYHPARGMLWIVRHNRWDLPKGKIDENESLEKAAIRETEEETGLKGLYICEPLGITRHAYRQKGEFILKTSHWYKMGTTQPNIVPVPQENEGITRVEWANVFTVQEKINNTYASLQALAKEFVNKHTDWKLS